MFLQILTLAVSIDTQNKVGGSSKEITALDFISSQTTKEFWGKNFGEKTYAVGWAKLEDALRKTYPKSVDASMLGDLKMRLDNFNTGSVSCFRLSEFVVANADGSIDHSPSLQKRLDEYLASAQKIKVGPIKGKKSGSETTESSTGGAIKSPILIWVDDKSNPEEVVYAKKRGVTVVALRSTAEAKEWIKDNSLIMEEEDTLYTKLRIITSNVRESAGTSLDINAGEDIVRFVRGRRYKAPILVYCGDLNYVKYVTKYEACTATNHRSDALQFVDGLKV